MLSLAKYIDEKWKKNALDTNHTTAQNEKITWTETIKKKNKLFYVYFEQIVTVQS